MLLLYGTFRHLHGKGYPGAEKIGMLCSAVFLKLVRPPFSDPTCAENRVAGMAFSAVSRFSTHTYALLYYPGVAYATGRGEAGCNISGLDLKNRFFIPLPFLFIGVRS